MYDIDCPESYIPHSWGELKDEVKKHNDAIYGLLDGILDNSTELHRVTGLYGSVYCQKGSFLNYPDSPVHSNSIPLCLVLDGVVEISYLQNTEGNSAPILPLQHIYPGELFGLFEALDRYYGQNYYAPWTITSGVISAPICGFRNAEIRNAITSTFGIYEEIPELEPNNRNGNGYVPTRYLQIINQGKSDSHGEAWQSSFIILPDSILEDPNLLSHILALAWQQSSGIRSRSFLDYQESKKNVVKQVWKDELNNLLLRIAKGYEFTYWPADLSDQLLPFRSSLEYLESEHPSVQNKFKKFHFPYVLTPRRIKPNAQDGQSNKGILSLSNINIIGNKPIHNDGHHSLANELVSSFRGWGKSKSSPFIVSETSVHTTLNPGNANKHNPPSPYYKDGGYFYQDFSEQINFAEHLGWKNTAPLQTTYLKNLIRIVIGDNKS